MFNDNQMSKYRDNDRGVYDTLRSKDEVSEVSMDLDSPQLPPCSSWWRRNRQTVFFAVLALSVTANIAQFVNIGSFRLPSTGSITTELFWNPFEHLLNYHIQVFPTSFPPYGQTSYMGAPSEELDDRWHNLYVEAFTVPKDQAAQLVNKTSLADPNNPEAGYVTSFSTFHYLHCLNGIRQLSNFVYYPESTNQSRYHNQFTHGLESFDGFEKGGMFDRDHLQHCIDHIRLALMCKPDLSPVVWQWRTAAEGGEADMIRPMLTTAHSCANFDAILDFAQKRAFNHKIKSDHPLDEQGGCRRTDKDCGYSKQSGNLLFEKDSYATETAIVHDGTLV